MELNVLPRGPNIFLFKSYVKRIWCKERGFLRMEKCIKQRWLWWHLETNIFLIAFFHTSWTMNNTSNQQIICGWAVSIISDTHILTTVLKLKIAAIPKIIGEYLQIFSPLNRSSHLQSPKRLKNLDTKFKLSTII